MRCSWPHWRETTRKGERVIVSPDGARVYYGTPSEVREAALMPWHRKSLAESLKLQRCIRQKGNHTADELRECCAGCRRDWIRHDGGVPDALVEIPAREYILLCAGSRLVRNGVKDFFAELWRSEIDALLDVAESETGKREIPLTRHEKAALARCEAAANTTSTNETKEGDHDKN